MDYTLSNSFVTDVGTGFRRHEDNQAIPTAVTEKDMNSLIWSLMEIVKAAGLVGIQFDEATPASYQLVLKALKRMVGVNASTFTAANSPVTLTADQAGLVLVDASAGNVVINLPAANATGMPLFFEFRRTDAAANTVTVNRAGANTIDEGGTSFELYSKAPQAIASNGAATWSSIGLGLATAAEAQAWSNPSKVLTPATLAAAFQGSNQNLVTNGYQKLPGGLILQWFSTIVLASSVTNLSHSIAFPNAHLAALVSTVGTTYAINQNAFVSAQPISLSQVAVQNNYQASGVTVAVLSLGR